MKKTLLISALIVCCSISVFGQQGNDDNDFEVFFGYSRQHIETEQFDEFERFAGLTRAQIQTNFNATPEQLRQGFDDTYRTARRLDGVNASVTYYFSGGLGVTGDFAYHYKNDMRNTPSNPIFFEDFTRAQRRSLTILGGPQYKFRRHARIQPFIRLLVGAIHQENQSSQFFNNPAGAGPPIETNRLEDNFTAFTIGGGGGVDIKLNRHWAIRAVQIDFLASFTRNRTASLTSNGGNIGATIFEDSRRDSMRFSFGVVFRW